MMAERYKHSICGAEMEFKKKEGWWCPKCERQPNPITWIKIEEGEQDGESGTSPGEQPVDKTEKEGAGCGTGRQEVLSEKKQDSSPETPESSSGDKGSGEGMPPRDTGIRKAGTIVGNCPSCHCLIFEATELFLIEVEDGKLLLRSAGHELTRQVVACHICGASFTIKQLEKMYLGEKPKAAGEEAKAE